MGDRLILKVWNILENTHIAFDKSPDKESRHR